MSYRKKRRGSSRVIKMKFQSFFDISTEDGSMQIISINAGGKNVWQRLSPFFTAYKYYKLGGVSFKLIPASTLPVDPTGLSYEEGENTVDPRDQLTPGMCRITNGEDVFEDISGMSAENQHLLYDNMLLDPRWYKWMLQSGVKRFGKPRYWQIGQLHQDKWPGSFINMPELQESSALLNGTSHRELVAKHNVSNDLQGANGFVGSSSHGFFQTGHRGVLGWLPTDSLQPIRTTAGGDPADFPLIASIPEIELFKILMPPAYKTKYYYRAFVTETVYFKDPIVLNINGFRPVDVFHSASGAPVVPSYSIPNITDAVYNSNSGGNDGSS